MKPMICVAVLVMVLATSGSLAAFVNPLLPCSGNCAFDSKPEENIEGCFMMSDKLYQSCSNCVRYLRCQGGKTIERGECTGGWWFSTVLQSCQPLTVTPCCGCDCTNPFTTTTSTTTTTTTTTTTPAPTTTTTPTTPAPTTTKTPTTPAPTQSPTQPPPQTSRPPPPRPCVGDNISTGYGCITGAPSSCHGRPDGDYQACEGCTFYHSCVAGYLNYAFRPCPYTDQFGLHGYLVWQRKAANIFNEGTCEYFSNTCTECVNRYEPLPTQSTSRPTTNTPPPPGPVTTPAPPSPDCDSTGRNCITKNINSCQGLPDGDYQACEDCTIFYKCSNGYISKFDCPPTSLPPGVRGKLVWQQWTANTGRCEYSSTSCRECDNIYPRPPTVTTTIAPPVSTTKTPSPVDPDWDPCESTGAGCIKASPGACQGRADGHYQACEGCTIYHSCSGGVLYSSRLCALTFQGGLRGRLVWRQVTPTAGICDYSSNTCTECDTSPDPTPVQPSCPPFPFCVDQRTNCSEAGLPDGDYQICQSCFHYLLCRGGVTTPCQACPTNGDVQQKFAIKSPTTGVCADWSDTCNQCPITPRTTQKPPVTSTPTPVPIVSTTEGDEEPWTPCQSTGSYCLTGFPGACQGRADGHYQACEGCTMYHSCSGGVLYSSRMCAKTFSGGLRGRLVWRQVTPTAGICDYTSNTCTECVIAPNPTVSPTCPAYPRCVLSGVDCREAGLADGDYQICQSCFHYLSCRNGETWGCRPCPSYNDQPWQWRVTSPTQGHCVSSSDTCNQCPFSSKKSGRELFMEEVRRLKLEVQRKSTGSSCITGLENSCEGRNDGDYQACESCSVFHSCVEGTIVANRDCPYGLVWQITGPGEGRCDYTSTSCRPAKKLRKTFEDVFF